ncbi:MAG: hypothetical protein HOJ46_01350 [Halieaceae bacterium]|nr:hypothetical protein [Halieaceae bacterium]
MKTPNVALDTLSPGSQYSRGNTHHLTYVNEAVTGQEVLLLGDHYLWFTVSVCRQMIASGRQLNAQLHGVAIKRPVLLISTVEGAMWVQGDVSASRESEREMGTWSHQLFD